ncbi:Zn-ribbon domain-containing OB-fold protein [Micromonosporaceae bacterium DT194]|uniref:Zn-ribbon domain-containing OB-fold protein n=1 Tax=Melissospora conviva TaxID=3388432 RepID=UPI003C1A2EB7
MIEAMSAPEVPPADETTAGWWDASREHRLVVQGCDSCGAVQHPPRGVCTGCGETGALVWRDDTGAGVVDSFTVVHRAPQRDLAVPYVIARVRLDCGVLLLTRLEGADAQTWRIDDRVRVAWVDLPDGRALPVFTPAD